jgi:hypothetical protein
VVRGPVAIREPGLHQRRFESCTFRNRMWRKLVAHPVRGRGVAGSSPAILTMANPHPRQPPSKLQPNQVVALRDRYAAGESMPVLAAEFGIHVSTVSLVVRGRLHKSLGGAISATRDRTAGPNERRWLPT